MRTNALPTVALLLFIAIPSTSVNASTDPPVVLAEGGGPGDGWAAVRVSIPAGTHVVVDFSGTDAVGMWMDSYHLVPLDGGWSPSGGHLYGEDGAGIGVRAEGWTGEDLDQGISPKDPTRREAFGGGGWVQKERFEGYIVLIIGGEMGSHSWRILTDGPGAAGLATSGSEVTFLRGEDFQAEKSAKASAEWLGARLSTEGRHDLNIHHALFGHYFRYHGNACLHSMFLGVCPLNQARLGYQNGAAAETGYLGWSFVNEDPGAWQFSIEGHADLRTHHVPANYNTGIVLLAADVALPDA